MDEGSLKNVPAQLKWIEGPPVPDRGLTLPGQERKKKKQNIWTRLADKVLIPLGLASTVACLSMGLYHMKQGDSKRQQMFMRGRVGFQSFTLAVMTLGIAFSAGIIGPKTDEPEKGEQTPE